MRGQFDSTQITELTFAVAIINAWYRLSISFRITPGSVDQICGLTQVGLKRIGEVELKLSDIEAVEVHHLVPSRDKVVNEFFLRVRASVDFSQGAKNGV